MMSMSARELHDAYANSYGGIMEIREGIAFPIILRALSLLSSVEDGEGIVRELDEAILAAKEELYSDPYVELAERCRARITLDAQEKAALKAELGSEREDRISCQAEIGRIHATYKGNAMRLLKAEAELASVKAHAEAMEGLLLLALYHHQGGSSPVGQPIRKLLGIGQHAHMTDEQIERAKAAGRAAHQKE